LIIFYLPRIVSEMKTCFHFRATQAAKVKTPHQILVAHLANSEEYDVAVINKIIQKLI